MGAGFLFFFWRSAILRPIQGAPAQAPAEREQQSVPH
jgi:hypothetical protein